MAERLIDAKEVKVSELECCPKLRQLPVCDTLNFRYRLPFRP